MVGCILSAVSNFRGDEAFYEPPIGTDNLLLDGLKQQLLLFPHDCFEVALWFRLVDHTFESLEEEPGVFLRLIFCFNLERCLPFGEDGR